MTLAAPLAPTLPLIVAAALAGARSFGVPRRVADTLAIATSVTTTALSSSLLIGSTHGPIVYWFGGWRPLPHGIAIGVGFSIDPVGAGLAVLAGTLVTCSLVYSWHYFEDVEALFHTLLLVFLGAMVAFSLTGDLFDLFVFFELMSVGAFVLAGYRVEERGPLQGALNFGVTNTVAAFMILWGIGLIYGRTGALNMAQIGQTLAGRPPDALVAASFLLITCGFFVKAAIFPFHFWIADTHAVAPTPVCILFSGVMIELGLYAIARVYWMCFSGVLHVDAGEVRLMLVVIGSITALVGAVMCFAQHHLKRLLAFSSMSHTGIFLIGISLLSPLGLAGTAVYVLGHAGVKAALFLCVGILLNHFGTVDEVRLQGRGRRLPLVGILYGTGGLALAAAPPFGTFLGGDVISTAADRVGYSWIAVVTLASAILVGGAVLRSAVVVFVGTGRGFDAFYSTRLGDEEPEEPEVRRRLPVFMIAPAILLLVSGAVVGLLPGLASHALQAAAMFEDRSYLAASVLATGAHPPSPSSPAMPALALSDLYHGVGSALGALLVALVAIHRARIPRIIRSAAAPLLTAVHGLRTLQSGDASDYVTWIMVGAACVAIAFTFGLHL
ncbi:MAG TPA: proton-conducting transporter membrane subunit [Candidatus Dormibacteraeota bacterium]|jgi:multicomponent Na+:H+ antiporter subunit D|nr:proton-conducting transporter membrane subunit [Candidatus Dormibacteraeota bacterium]